MMAARRLNRRQTGYVLAGSMGLSMGMAFAFFIFAMPSAMFESIIVGSGLPSLTAAAQPPLGETARIGVAGMAGLLAGAVVIALSLLSDRYEERRRSATKRPLSVHADFAAFEAAMSPAHTARPIPAPASVLDRAPEYPAPIVSEETPAKPEQPPEQANDGPIFVDFQAFRGVQRPVDEAPLDLGQWQVIPTPESEPAQIAPEPTPPAAKTASPVAAKLVEPMAEDDSIAAMMQRLEAGLDRRIEQGNGAAVPPTISSNPAGLRSTLEELRKMAVRR